MSTTNKKLQQRLWKISQSNNELSKIQCFRKEIGDECFKEVLFSVHKASGDTISHLLARLNKIKTLRNLYIEFKIPLDKCNLAYKQPLHEAAASKSSDVVMFLLKQNFIKVDPLKISGWTPLMMACNKAENFSIIKMLVEQKASTDLCNKDGWNALHLACRSGHLETVKYLYNTNRLSIKVTSNNGRSPLHTAALHGRTKVVQFLVDVCKIPLTIKDSCGSCPLIDACRSGDPRTIQACLLNLSFSESAVDKRGFNCLHAAAEAGQSDSIRFLVKSLNFDVNRKVEEIKSLFYQQTALHVAYMNGQNKCVETLLQLGALSNITDCNGRLANELKPKRKFLS